MKTAVEFKIQNYRDRENMVSALANSGYFVRVEERERDGQIGTDYYIIVGREKEG
ncbi:MAG: hypothetical protein PHO27_12095 [Sulfuricurvum sp.]|jgi:hypothetical protein|nr:hypothetical protein [Sulfuricurvum sp.]